MAHRGRWSSIGRKIGVPLLHHPQGNVTSTLIGEAAILWSGLKTYSGLWDLASVKTKIFLQKVSRPLIHSNDAIQRQSMRGTKRGTERRISMSYKQKKVGDLVPPELELSPPLREMSTLTPSPSLPSPLFYISLLTCAANTTLGSPCIHVKRTGSTIRMSGCKARLFHFPGCVALCEVTSLSYSGLWKDVAQCHTEQDLHKC